MNKTLVTYLGGSAGDFFAASVNGISIDLQGKQHLGGTNVEYSLKKFEPAIENGTLDLPSLIDSIPWSMISTHLYEPLRGIAYPVISLIVDDDTTIKTIILRQMQFQKLKLSKDSGTFSSLIYKLVQDNKWEKAAELWISMADRIWRQNMLTRINEPLLSACVLNFNRLFHEDFIDDLERQGWDRSIDLLRTNHRIWLANNLDFSTEKTLHSMIDKLQHELID